MKNYNHLDLSQRYIIQSLLTEGRSKDYIAGTLGLHVSTIHREVSRNKDERSGLYRASLAGDKCTARHKVKHKHTTFSPGVEQFVKECLSDQLSPEQIAGLAKDMGRECVSHERIYQHIWSDKHKGGLLYKQLRNRGERYRKRGALKDTRGLITNRIDIDKRPTIVDAKSRIGDLEVDTIIGKKHRGAIVTINDRATGVLKMKRVKSKEAKEVSEAIIEPMEEWKPLIHTMTPDNGKEFAMHQQIAPTLDLDFYFAKPYHSWQRGANENLNGLIRQYLPKQTDFHQVTDLQISQIENRPNNRPIKRFQFKSPNQVFAATLDNLNKLALIT